MPLNKAPFGRRPASIEIDVNFMPQIFTCNVCQDKRDEFQVYFLQNQCLYSDIYIIYSWYKFTDLRGAVLNLVTRCHCRGKTTSKLNLKSAWETNIYWQVWNKRRHRTLRKLRCVIWWWWYLWYGFHERLPNKDIFTFIRILWVWLRVGFRRTWARNKSKTEGPSENLEYIFGKFLCKCSSIVVGWIFVSANKEEHSGIILGQSPNKLYTIW